MSDSEVARLLPPKWRYERFAGGWHVHTLRDRRGDRAHITFLPAVGKWPRGYEASVVMLRQGIIEVTHRIGERRTLPAAKRLVERTIAKGTLCV